MKKILLLLLLAVPALADQPVRYTFTAPTSGLPAERYVVEVRWDGGEWTWDQDVTGLEFIIQAPPGVQVEARVAGVDEFNRTGPWSLPSEPFTDLGPPGAPGQPELVGLILGALGALAVALFSLIRRKTR